MLRPGVPERLTLPFPGRTLCPAPTASEGGAAARSEEVPRHGFVAAPDRRLVAQREANPLRYRHLGACRSANGHQGRDGRHHIIMTGHSGYRLSTQEQDLVASPPTFQFPYVPY